MLTLQLVVLCGISNVLASPVLHIQHNMECENQWEVIRMEWNKTNEVIPSSSVLRSPSSLREHLGLDDEAALNDTETRLLVTAKYSTGHFNSYTCNSTVMVHTSPNNSVVWRENVSVQIQLPLIGSQIVGVRLIRIASYVNQLEIYLRPGETALARKLNHSLSYCWVDEHGFGMEWDAYFICPKFTSVSFKCSNHERGVYNVPKTNGATCVASIKDVMLYSVYRFYIVTNGNSFISESHIFNVQTKGSDDHHSPHFTKRGGFAAVLISQRPRYLRATALKSRRVHVKWENTGAQLYRLRYNCSNGVNGNGKLKERNAVLLSNVKFQPYSSCYFCVQGLRVIGSVYSEPMCNTTRLLEEAPSQAPTITCDSDTCPSTNEGETRDTTITCDFPPEEKSNGLLTKLVVKYWNETSESAHNEHFQFNLSSCRVVLPGLSSKHVYFAAISVCNSEGCSGFSDIVKISALYGTEDNILYHSINGNNLSSHNSSGNPNNSTNLGNSSTRLSLSWLVFFSWLVKYAEPNNC